MPNFDGGHYFLTALAPIHADPCQGPGAKLMSPAAAIREELAMMPTAAQSQACLDSGFTSPFSRCHRTHLARFAVIDQPAFNGRARGDPLVQTLRKTDLLVHDPVDTLARSWLLLAIDFDPGAAGADGLHDYLAGLWDVMSEELRAVYSHCYDFTATVQDRDGFARYIQRCQIETTMPFNDYWITPPLLPSISLPAILGAAVVFALAVGVLVGLKAGLLWGLLAAVVALASAILVAYRYVYTRGLKPFPAAPNSDLKSILKSLYLQQQFARFAIAHQGKGAETLHAGFGTFLAAHQPGDLSKPTQPPGVIGS